MQMTIELKKILCPVDFSETSSHATHYAVALAEKFDSELLLLHSGGTVGTCHGQLLRRVVKRFRACVDDLP